MPSPAAQAVRRETPPRAAWLLLAAGCLALALALHGAIAQWSGYHHFADARSWLGLPNAANVLSNLPFALIGLWGLWCHCRSPAAVSAPTSRAAWACFSLALVCTAFGSALYHWAPANGWLVLDRLPIAWACAAFLCAFLGERVDLRWAGAPTLAAGFIAATAAVGWWWVSEQAGRGDLRAYLYVQFLPMLIVPLALWLKLPTTCGRAVGNASWWTVLGLYAAAKLMELADAPVFEALGVTSGHTLKHVLAAGAALVVLRAAFHAERPARTGAQLR